MSENELTLVSSKIQDVIESVSIDTFIELWSLNVGIAERIKFVRGKLSQDEFSQKIGVHKSSLGRYERGESIPDSNFLGAICLEFGIATEWLLLGSGPMLRDDGLSMTPLSDRTLSSSHPISIPVTGLASCGLKDWYSPESIAMRVTLPSDVKSDSAIAVIAIGSSMQPLGIRSGNIAICDTSLSLEKGDIAYILKKDGTAGIKTFMGKDEEWVHLQGWLPPNEQGGQKPYREKCAMTVVALVAPVVYVRVKA